MKYTIRTSLVIIACYSLIWQYASAYEQAWNEPVTNYYTAIEQ